MSHEFQPLPEPPPGFRCYRTPEEVRHAPELYAYQHLLLKAWGNRASKNADDKGLELSGILTVNGIPTVFVSDHRKPLPARAAAALQLAFWNQGLATTFLLREPGRVRVFSALCRPLALHDATDETVEKNLLVETIELATQAAWHECALRLYEELANGHYYARHPLRFDPEQSVDAYLLDNLKALRDRLVTGARPLSIEHAHALLGRVLFTCYLTDRGIIRLENYQVGAAPGDKLLDLLNRDVPPERLIALLYEKLFRKLRQEFNGSMFDDNLEAEQAAIRAEHLKDLRLFLEGGMVRSGQGTLGFAAYEFDHIPVETISSIYETFLEREDEKGKRELGAYYTPRLLAELTIDLTLRDYQTRTNHTSLSALRFLDPACGSGIFLVLIFNRLVAEWDASQNQRRQPSVSDRIDALESRLARLCGVDRNLTACRITCFSLYLAFLEHFKPADIREFFIVSGQKKLPNLLVADQIKKAIHPVVWNRDFLTLEANWNGNGPFDVVLGNPPWVGRGNIQRQVEQKFVLATPRHLHPRGVCGLILPSKIFLNNTDAFQKTWLETMTLECAVQLADYRFVIFKDAQCPATIVRFNPTPPEPDHLIEYLAPKVSCADLRDGAISVSPQDRKWISQHELLAAAANKAVGSTWKRYLWGTSRDRKLLAYLQTYPRLSEWVGEPHEVVAGHKRWNKGQGFKPDAPGAGDYPAEGLDDRYLDAGSLGSGHHLHADLCGTVREHLEAKKRSLKAFHRLPPAALFQPPLITINQGFTEFGFFDYPVRFRHAIQSISGHKKDTPLFHFLSAYLSSPLARYVMFHTSANLGVERDKVLLEEIITLPFFAPDHPDAPADSQTAFDTITSRFAAYLKSLKQTDAERIKRLAKAKTSPGELWNADSDTVANIDRDWAAKRQAATDTLHQEIDPLIYAYFGLSEQEVALVKDTCEIFDKSDTPPSLASARKSAVTLQPLTDAGNLADYAECLCATFNTRAHGKNRVVSSGQLDDQTGLAMVELTPASGRGPRTFVASPSSEDAANGNTRLLEAAARMREATQERTGPLLELQSSGWFFDGPRIVIVKPSRRGEWTRTAALNDATELQQHIVAAGRATRS
jgi:hypothetical protein